MFISEDRRPEDRRSSQVGWLKMLGSKGASRVNSGNL
jgi:hypothetical protein